MKNKTTRPLGALSEFVVEVFPQKLENPHFGLTDECEKLVKEIPQSIIQDLLLQDGNLDLALLDLKIIEAGLTHSGLNLPPLLVALIDRLVGDGLPTLSYEDIILLNPIDDMRLFTRGEVGKTEAAFYIGHAVIEECLEPAIQKVRHAIKCLTVEPSSDLSLNGIEEDLKPIMPIMSLMKSMDAVHFALFRKYLGSNPLRDTKGPSGAFTAKVPILELLFKEEVPEHYIDYIKVNRRYFPQRDMTKLDQALEIHQTRRTLMKYLNVCDLPQHIMKQADCIAEFLNEFRRSHYRAVVKQLPEAVNGKISGTGGEEDPGVFLRRRIKELKNQKIIKETASQ